MVEPRREFITVVSGLPRSGTSMAMRMLEQGGLPVLTDDRRKADEDNRNGYYEYEPATQLRRDNTWLGAAVGKAVKIVYLLLYQLPAHYTYRVILMQRNLAEVLVSQSVMLQRANKAEAAHENEQLAVHFRTELEQLDTWLARQSHISVLRINYNEILENPDPQLAAIADFLGGNLDTSAMRAVLDPTLYRQRARSSDDITS